MWLLTLQLALFSSALWAHAFVSCSNYLDYCYDFFCFCFSLSYCCFFVFETLVCAEFISFLYKRARLRARALALMISRKAGRSFSSLSYSRSTFSATAWFISCVFFLYSCAIPISLILSRVLPLKLSSHSANPTSSLWDEIHCSQCLGLLFISSYLILLPATFYKCDAACYFGMLWSLTCVFVSSCLASVCLVCRFIILRWRRRFYLVCTLWLPVLRAIGLSICSAALTSSISWFRIKYMYPLYGALFRWLHHFNGRELGDSSYR